MSKKYEAILTFEIIDDEGAIDAIGLETAAKELEEGFTEDDDLLKNAKLTLKEKRETSDALLPSDKTYEKYKEQWELYKEAHNGYGQYLSYCLFVAENKIEELKKRVKFLDALEEAGVDNWSGISHAYELMAYELMEEDD